MPRFRNKVPEPRAPLPALFLSGAQTQPLGYRVPEPLSPLPFAPGPGACLGRVGMKVTFGAPSWAGGGARGAAGIGAPRSPAPQPARVRPNFLPRPRPAPSAALRSSCRSVRGPRRPLPPLRQPPRALDLRPGSRLPGTRPARPAWPPGKMRLLPEWLLLLFGPWLLRKVRAALR